MTNPAAPHTAIILLNAHVTELLPTGECSGRLADVSQMAEFNIQPKMKVSITGFNLEDCLTKLKRILDEFNK